jgi:hypothetical protein
MTDFSKMTVQSVIALEARTAAEQNKRQSLLKDSKKLSSYAEQKEISTAKMQSLLSANYENNKETLESVRDYMKTKDFKEKQAKQKKGQKTIKFKGGGGSRSEPVSQIFEGPSLIKIRKGLPLDGK